MHTILYEHGANKYNRITSNRETIHFQNLCSVEELIEIFKHT